MWKAEENENLRYDYGNGLDIHIAYCRNQKITQLIADILNQQGVKLNNRVDAFTEFINSWIDTNMKLFGGVRPKEVQTTKGGCMSTLIELESAWMQKVIEHQKNLRSLIATYHPAMNQPKQNLPITAPNAERACEVVRESIRSKEFQNPLERWDKAIQEKNIPEINSLLNGAWFGVPESTSCWSIPGFKEAVDLMDDPPYEQGDNDDDAA